MKLKDLIEMINDQAMERMVEARVAIDCDEAEKAEIARMVGVATLKYADLMNHHSKNYVFDVERFSSFEVRTGPYLLYTVVRIKSVLRNAAALGFDVGPISLTLCKEERDVHLKLTELPEILQLAFENRAPNYLCDYGHDLAKRFNRFYVEHHILREADEIRRASWLALCRATALALGLVLELLGIEAPERM